MALLLLGAGFAGCIGGKDDGKDDLKATNASANTSVFTAPPDGRAGTISAFNETNQTEAGAGGVAHTHDLWEGRTRITLFDQPAMISPGTSIHDPASWGEGAAAVLGVPRPLLVFEGTASVEFTLSEPGRHACEGVVEFSNHFVCTDDTTSFGSPLPPASAPDPTGGPSGLILRYRHASTSTWIDAGSLAWNTPLKIKITDPKQTDMPHSTASLWQFMVASPNPQDRTLTFRAKADIVRGEGPIPMWPGHPQFYTDTVHVREIFDGEAQSVSGTTSGIANGGDSAPITPKKLISYGTRSLYVWANVTSVSSTNPATAPTDYYLYHTNATGKENITSPGAENATVDPTHFFWILPVRDDDMDSPYQDGSRFQFQLNGVLASCINCADYVLKYHLTIKASDLDETGKYHIYCWDANDC